MHDLLEAAVGPAPALDEMAVRDGARRRRRRRRAVRAGAAVVLVIASLGAWQAADRDGDSERPVVAGEPERPVVAGDPEQPVVAGDPEQPVVAEPPVVAAVPVPQGAATVPQGGWQAGRTAGPFPVCPAPVQPVPVAGASILRAFTDALVSGDGAPPTVPAVATQVDALEPVERPTRVVAFGNFWSSENHVQACFQSHVMTPAGLQVSFDRIGAQLVSGSWQIVEWTRGKPVAAGNTDTVSVPFPGPDWTCARPTYVDVDVPVLMPERAADIATARANFALSELLSGPVGRSGTRSPIPPDVMLAALPIAESDVARVIIVDTSERLDECTGRAAIELIERALRQATGADQVVISGSEDARELLALGANR